jgi:hypothetical protein
MVLKTNSLLLEGMGKIKEPTPSIRELSSARVLHAPVPPHGGMPGDVKNVQAVPTVPSTVL